MDAMKIKVGVFFGGNSVEHEILHEITNIIAVKR